MNDLTIKIREQIVQVVDITPDRGGRIEIGSAGPRHSVLMSGDHEGLTNLALAILDHVLCDAEHKGELTFVNNIFSDVSEIKSIIITTLPKYEPPVRIMRNRQSFIFNIFKVIFRRRNLPETGVDG